jgi:hypothetical protein
VSTCFALLLANVRERQKLQQRVRGRVCLRGRLELCTAACVGVHALTLTRRRRCVDACVPLRRVDVCGAVLGGRGLRSRLLVARAPVFAHCLRGLRRLFLHEHLGDGLRLALLRSVCA